MAQTFSETVRDRFDDVIHLHYSFLCDTTQTVTCQQLALMAILSFLSSFLYWIGFGIWIWWGRGETGAGDSWRFLEILGDSWWFLGEQLEGWVASGHLISLWIILKWLMKSVGPLARPGGRVYSSLKRRVLTLYVIRFPRIGGPISASSRV